MRVSLLKHTWKAVTEYTYAYVLITGHYSIQDIISSNKKICFLGSTPDSAQQWSLLNEHGLQADCLCDIHNFIRPRSIGGIPVRSYWELLKEADNYYFIVTLKNWFSATEAIKSLLYAGLDEFGLVAEGYSKDFESSSNTSLLQESFFNSLNEIFLHEPLLNSNSLENLRRCSLEGAGYWDALYVWIYKFNKTKQNAKISRSWPGAGHYVLLFEEVARHRRDLAHDT